jgi:hypothetical protein
MPGRARRHCRHIPLASDRRCHPEEAPILLVMPATRRAAKDGSALRSEESRDPVTFA